MRYSPIFNHLTIAAVSFTMLLSECSKKDNSLSNLPVERNDATQAQVIDATSITSDMVLTDRVNGVDYIIENNVQLSANLTINPGVTIQFKDGAGIQVNNGGSITAIGSASGGMIYFSAQSGRRGAWKGITILSNSAKNVLSYCKIEQGGGQNDYGTADVVIGSSNAGALVEISNSEITTSNADGIVVAKGSKLPGFTANKLYTNTAFPVTMNINDANQLDNSNQYSNNGKEYIHIISDNSPSQGVIELQKLNEPYLISGGVTAENGFIIHPGTIVNMDSDAGIVIDGLHGNGSFNAVGTAEQPITIKSVYNGAGVWGSISFVSSSSNQNIIEHCSINGGGMQNAMISATNVNGGSSQLVVRNCNIMNSGATGIYIQSSSTTYNSDIATVNSFANNAHGNIQFN